MGRERVQVVPAAWAHKPDAWREHVATCRDCNVRYGDGSLAVVTVRREDIRRLLDGGPEWDGGEWKAIVARLREAIA